MVQSTKCPKCQGKLFLDRDRYGWYEQCLQCGYIKNVEAPAGEYQKPKSNSGVVETVRVLD